MATSKTLTPTNVTIQIPAFTDQPDQRVNSNCIDKEADAINALNSNLTSLSEQIANKASYYDIGTYSISSTIKDMIASICDDCRTIMSNLGSKTLVAKGFITNQGSVLVICEDRDG